MECVPTVHAPTTLPLSSQLESVASWEVPHDKLAKKEKFQAWIV